MISLRETYEQDGVVRVAGAIAPEDVLAMREVARAHVAATEMVEIAGALRPARGTELALWAVGREPAFACLPDALARAVDRVFGAGVWTPIGGELGGTAMPNLPCPGARRTACGVAWHADEATLPGSPSGRALLGYAFLDLVEPGGGATVVIAGSHRRLAAIADRLAAPISQTDAPGLLAREEPWFAAIVEREELGDGCVSAGIPLRGVELTGEPGDLVLLDARCLHTISANVSPRARLVMRLTCMPGPSR